MPLKLPFNGEGIVVEAEDSAALGEEEDGGSSGAWLEIAIEVVGLSDRSMGPDARSSARRR